VIHGLDELIKVYLAEGELVVGTERIPLIKPLLLLPPPHDCKRHGRVNRKFLKKIFNYALTYDGITFNVF